jgi:hypothetical protein
LGGSIIALEMYQLVRVFLFFCTTQGAKGSTVAVVALAYLPKYLAQSKQLLLLLLVVLLILLLLLLLLLSLFLYTVVAIVVVDSIIVSRFVNCCFLLFLLRLITLLL